MFKSVVQKNHFDPHFDPHFGGGVRLKVPQYCKDGFAKVPRTNSEKARFYIRSKKRFDVDVCRFLIQNPG